MITCLFDSEIKVGYGWWECPKCGSQFYGGGKAIHKNGCDLKYDGCNYHYSLSEVQRWKEDVKERGYFAHPPLSPSVLKDHLTVEAVKNGELDPETFLKTSLTYLGESATTESRNKCKEAVENLIQRAKKNNECTRSSRE